MKFPNNENHSSETGAALITSILALLLATLLGFALVTAGLTAANISNNGLQQTESFYISESGLTHAMQLVENAGASEFTNILQAGDGTAGTGDELSTQPGLPIPQAGLTSGRGMYIVSVRDDAADTDGDPNADSNGRLVITSTGVGRDGATNTTEAIVSLINPNELPALLVGGKLHIHDDLILKGTNGIAHANGTLEFHGDPCSDRYFSSSANITFDGGNSRGPNCVGPGTNISNAAVVTPPVYDIRTDFYSHADYILGAIGAQAGRVYDSSGNLIYDANSDPWEVGDSQWDWNSSNWRWTHQGSELPDGTYYSEGNIKMNDDFGSAAFPARVTLIAEGYIEATHNFYTQPDYLSYSMVAGTDLHIEGDPGFGETNFQGIHYAGHQVDFRGNPSIDGVVIAANQADSGSPGCGCNIVQRDSDGFVKITHQPTITYNGGLFGGVEGLTLISWREVRY